MTTLDEIAGIPTVCDVALALYSKLLPDRVQGAGQVTRDSHLMSIMNHDYYPNIQQMKYQAFRRLVSQVALLLGPLWAPATLNNPMLMLAVPLGCRLFTHIFIHIGILIGCCLEIRCAHLLY